jgi:hypothetical protein
MRYGLLFLISVLLTICCDESLFFYPIQPLDSGFPPQSRGTIRDFFLIAQYNRTAPTGVFCAAASVMQGNSPENIIGTAGVQGSIPAL